MLTVFMAKNEPVPMTAIAAIPAMSGIGLNPFMRPVSGKRAGNVQLGGYRRLIGLRRLTGICCISLLRLICRLDRCRLRSGRLFRLGRLDAFFKGVKFAQHIIYASITFIGTEFTGAEYYLCELRRRSSRRRQRLSGHSPFNGIFEGQITLKWHTQVIHKLV